MSLFSVAASIITYNPDLNILRQNIESIYPQVKLVLVIDNGSTNIDEIQRVFSDLKNVILISNPKNKGIAYALNQAAKNADELQFEWLITLDQDSICPPQIIQNYSTHIHIPTVGMICCRILDQNVGELQQEPVVGDMQEVEDCITSASMLRLSAWKATSGFCDEMFIDSVDFDFCYVLRSKGYVIRRDNQTFLHHELGHSSLVNFFGKKLYLFHHSPTRNYYIIRNTIYTGQRHHRNWHFLKIALKRSFLILLFERQRIANLKAIVQAYYHAFIKRYGERTPI